MNYQRVLIIRLGALGDLVLCSPAFQAIRAAQPQAQITLLTQPAWVGFARSMPWFDAIITDTRPSLTQPAAWHALLRDVRRAAPQCVYDLQGKLRQTLLYGLLGGLWGKMDWSGAAPGCRYPRVWPPQPNWHFQDFIAAQLQAAGITMPADADYRWLDAPVDDLALPKKFVMLIPGCAPTRPEKRWPAPAYAELARSVMQRGYGVVMIGAKAEADVLRQIAALAPGVVDLGGKTSLPQIGSVARRAAAVVGNDTGPTHIAASVGAPTLSLFTGSVNPVWSAPRGPRARYWQTPVLQDLPAVPVLEKIAPWLT